MIIEEWSIYTLLLVVKGFGPPKPVKAFVDGDGGWPKLLFNCVWPKLLNPVAIFTITIPITFTN